MDPQQYPCLTTKLLTASSMLTNADGFLWSNFNVTQYQRWSGVKTSIYSFRKLYSSFQFLSRVNTSRSDVQAFGYTPKKQQPYRTDLNYMSINSFTFRACVVHPTPEFNKACLVTGISSLYCLNRYYACVWACAYGFKPDRGRWFLDGEAWSAPSVECRVPMCGAIVQYARCCPHFKQFPQELRRRSSPTTEAREKI